MRYIRSIYSKLNIHQRNLLIRNKEFLMKKMEKQGMRHVRNWIFVKLGIHMKAVEVRRFYKLKKKKISSSDAFMLAQEMAGRCGNYSPLGINSTDTKLSLHAAGLVRAGEKLKII